MTRPDPRGRFTKTQRLRRRGEFLRLTRCSERVHTKHFVLLLASRSDRKGPRLGVTASRRVGNAVQRSRCKRLVREAFRATRQLWEADCDVLVIAKSGAAGLSLAQVTEEWLGQGRRIRERLAKFRDRSSGIAPKKK